MKTNLIIAINLGDFGSTGTIMRNALEYANAHGDFDYLVLTPQASTKINNVSFKTDLNIFEKILRKFSLLFRNQGKYDGFFYNKNSLRIIDIINENKKIYENVIVHLHNIHHCAINIEILFSYLAKENFPVVYTLHDEWLFTGGCYCYSHINCDKWKHGCTKCPLHIQHSKRLLNIKAKLVNRISSLKIVTVSNWLENEVKQSFISNVSVCTIYGETNIPKKQLEVTKKEILGNHKYMLLSVAAYWSDWKGAKYLIELAKIIPNDFLLVIVGKNFPHTDINNIKIIDTELNYEQLSQLYSSADFYISTSQSETLGLTTCEAQICGCPVIGFGNCGSKETISSLDGYIVPNKDVNAIAQTILDNINKQIHKNRIKQFGEKFSRYSNCKKYLDLYEEMICKK